MLSRPLRLAVGAQLRGPSYALSKSDSAHGKFGRAGQCRLFCQKPPPNAVETSIESVQYTSVPIGLAEPRQAGALGALAEQGGFVPKPETYDEKLKPGFRGGKALLVFFLCNAVPAAAVMYYFREQRLQRAGLSMMALPSAVEDVVSEVMRVIRTTHLCFFQVVDSKTAGAELRVDPHTPEGSPYTPADQPLPLVPQLERNSLTDIFESPPVAGLGYIHFAVSRHSPQGAAILAGSRQARLMYMSSTRGGYCSVYGALSVVSDADSRRHYWKNHWAAAFLPEAASEPEGVQKAPSASPTATQQPVLPPAWSHKDYMLVRMAVVEVTLQALVDGPERWDQRRAKRVEDNSGTRWVLSA